MKAWKQNMVMVSFLLLAACGNQDQGETISLGVVLQPEVELATKAGKIAQKNHYDFNLKPIVFSDYTQATLALCEGKVDASIEALPYVQQQLRDPSVRNAMKSMNCELAMLTHTFIYSMGIYSRTIHNLNQLPPQAVVAVSAAPLSGARALLLLQSAGLIQLRAGVSTNATVNDIVSNPQGLIIVPIDPAQLSGSIAGATLIVVSAASAAEAGSALKDALLTESSPEYSMVILVRNKDLQDAEFAGLVELYHSPGVIDAAEAITGNSAVPSWDNYRPASQ